MMTERNDDPDAAGSTAWFIERYGLLTDHMPRTAGRMLALMLIEGGPFGFAELATRLQVSRAGISTNTNLLIQAGMIERSSRPGDRQDYFRIADDLWPRVLESQLKKQRRAANYAQTVLEMQKNLTAAARDRLAALIAIVDRTEAMTSTIIRDLTGKPPA